MKPQQKGPPPARKAAPRKTSSNSASDTEEQRSAQAVNTVIDRLNAVKDRYLPKSAPFAADPESTRAALSIEDCWFCGKPLTRRPVKLSTVTEIFGLHLGCAYRVHAELGVAITWRRGHLHVREQRRWHRAQREGAKP
jgi:hypothetical protein